MANNSKAATLAAMLATDTATATAPVTVKKNAIKTAPVAPTSAPTVKTTTTIPVADGYNIAITDDIDAAQIKAAIVRNTANPWYAVALMLASRKCATFRIVRNDGVKGTPLARINAAMARGQKIRMDAILRGVKVPTEVLYFHKLGVSQHATEKNTWMFVKTA